MKVFSSLSMIAVTSALTSAYLTTSDVNSVELTDEFIRAEFDAFVATFRPDGYSSSVEAARRFEIFSENIRTAYENNKESSTVYGVTPFSDMSSDEFKNTLTFTAPSGLDGGVYAPGNNIFNQAGVSYPLKVDWREKNCDTGVHDQGTCGSCWAFATVGMVEGTHCAATGELLNLSPAYLVDCDHKQQGCDGASDIIEPAEFVVKGGGLPTIKEYPRMGRCKKNVALHGSIKNAVQLDGASADDIALHIANHGPLNVVVDASNFASYRGGVMNARDCRGLHDLNHAITAIGYEVDPESKKGYLLIKNSWSTGWGEKGLIRMEFGVCSLGKMVTGVVAEKKSDPEVDPEEENTDPTNDNPVELRM